MEMVEPTPDTSLAMSEEPDALSLAEFLEGVPPNQEVRIKDLSERKIVDRVIKDVLATPDIQLHCPSQSCNGLRFFRSATMPIALSDEHWRNCYVNYHFSNCRKNAKTYALSALMGSSTTELSKCYKFGENPPFGPPTPARLIKLVGPDRELFLSGRRCENQGFGIVAFVYYRRVVENQKNPIISNPQSSQKTGYW